MGRRPKKAHAIPRLRVRKQKSGRIFYYYDHGIDVDGKRKESPLGSDYGLAIKRWAEMEHEHTPSQHAILLFRHVADRYRAEIIPTKAPRTQKDNLNEIGWLLKFFDDPPAPFEEIRPINIRQYIDWREAKIRANREVALLSHIWNWAREKGYTDLSNPCKGIRRHKEVGRDVYIDDATYAAVYSQADQPLRDAMDLAYLTGQRIGDVRGMSEHQMTSNSLLIKQGKTKAKIEMEIVGELATLLDRIRNRKRELKLYSTYLIVDENGLAIGRDALRYRFDKARKLAGVKKEDFQFRDLRAKAGTDKADSGGDIRLAQAQLGHTSIVMTEHYVRKRKGTKTTPTR